MRDDLLDAYIKDLLGKSIKVYDDVKRGDFDSLRQIIFEKGYKPTNRRLVLPLREYISSVIDLPMVVTKPDRKFYVVAAVYDIGGRRLTSVAKSQRNGVDLDQDLRFVLMSNPELTEDYETLRVFVKGMETAAALLLGGAASVLLTNDSKPIEPSRRDLMRKSGVLYGREAIMNIVLSEDRFIEDELEDRKRDEERMI